MLAELGEDAVLARIAERLPGPPTGEIWSGDDAAVLSLGAEPLLFTADALVEGVDFQLAWASPDDVGFKSIAANASDIAAMGGLPERALVTLCLHPSTPLAVVDGLLEGMATAAERWGIGLAGGDLSRGRELVVSVALIGTQGPAGPVLRSGARVGEAICVTGTLGGAAAGLLALRARGGRARERSGALWRLVERQLRPAARVDEGLALARAGVGSMMDLSDGLAADLARLTEASGVGCRISPERVPVDPDLVTAVEEGDLEEVDPVETAVVGGEDFELLFTIDERRLRGARAALEALGTPVTRIGEVAEGGGTIGDADLDTWRERAWDHLRR